MLAAIEGSLISGYGIGGDDPEKPLELVPGAADAARTFLQNHPASLGRFERVAQLVEGFESSFGMELIATVHWVMAREHARGEGVVAAVHGWNPRKSMFWEDQIHMAAKRILLEGWLAQEKASSDRSSC